MLKKLKERCCCKSNRTSVPALSMVGSVVVMAALAALTGLYLAVYETGRSTRTKAVTATVWPLGVVLFGASAALLWHAVRVSARTRGMSPSAALRWVLVELRTPGFSHTKHPLSSTKTQRADVAAVIVVAAGAVLLLAALAGLSGAVATNRSGGNTTVRAAALNGGQRVVAPPPARAETVLVETTFFSTVVRVVDAVPRLVPAGVRSAGATSRLVRPDGMFDSNRSLVVAFTLAPGATARVRLEADAPVRAELRKNNATAEVRADISKYALDVTEPAADTTFTANGTLACTTYLLNVTAPRGAARVSYSVVVNATRYAAEETAVQTVSGRRRHALALRPGQLVVVEQQPVPLDMYPIFEDFAVVCHRRPPLAATISHNAWHVLYAALIAVFVLYWFYYYIILFLLLKGRLWCWCWH